MLSEERIRTLLKPYVTSGPESLVLPDGLYGAMAAYLDLLMKWNARTNLTAVRDPEQMVRRHFGESLFAGSVLARFVKGGVAVLDLGSGAGLPGVPIQVLLPDVHVTLAESQGKKAAFLREVVRTLGLSAEVWAGRVESMPADCRFDVVTMRAVDRMEAMEVVARERLRQASGLLLKLTTTAGEEGQRFSMPGAAGSFVQVVRVNGFDVPRGTQA